MAGGAVMITALFIAAGMEVSQTTVTKVIVYKSCGEESLLVQGTTCTFGLAESFISKKIKVSETI